MLTKSIPHHFFYYGLATKEQEDSFQIKKHLTLKNKGRIDVWGQ